MEKVKLDQLKNENQRLSMSHNHNNRISYLSDQSLIKIDLETKKTREKFDYLEELSLKINPILKKFWMMRKVSQQ